MDILKCKICGRYYRHLGSHLWHGHRILSKEYKEQFELPYNMALITDEIKEKKRRKAYLWQKTWKKNFKNSKKYQIGKPQSGIHSGTHRTSQWERRIIIERIKKVNQRKKKLSQCPVCKMKYYYIESHLFNKHRLLKVKIKVGKINNQIIKQTYANQKF